MHVSLKVEEALDRVLAHFSPLPAETVDVLDALRRVLAEDAIAPLDIPPFTNSAMDGYAVRAEDTAAAGRDRPAVLRVVADIAAGREPDRAVEPGTCARIMTGAPMPPGADAVDRYEDTSEGRRPGGEGRGETVEIYRGVQPGDNIRHAGEDVRAGQVVVPAGTVIRPQEVGVLASLGKSRVRVHRRPRVAVLATGDELVAIDEPLTPGKIRNSNEYSTAALVLRDGGIPVRLGIARDNVPDLTARLQAGLDQQVDLFLTSAGVSVGDYDMVKDVLGTMGEVGFWQVRIKPGKPLAFGHIGGVPLLGLPGNPVSAMVAYEAFARPAIRRMLGYRELQRPAVRAIVEEDIENSGRRHYMRALLRRREGGYSVTTRGSGVEIQGSGILSSMIWANCFLVVPEEVTFIPAGSEVDVEPLD